MITTKTDKQTNNKQVVLAKRGTLEPADAEVLYQIYGMLLSKCCLWTIEKKNEMHLSYHRAVS